MIYVNIDRPYVCISASSLSVYLSAAAWNMLSVGCYSGCLGCWWVEEFTKGCRLLVLELRVATYVLIHMYVCVYVCAFVAQCWECKRSPESSS